RQVGEGLQTPGGVVAAAVEKHAGEIEVKLAEGGLIVVVLALLHGQLHELQRPDTIALEAADVAAAAPFMAAIELAGDDVAVMLDVRVALGCRFQQAPILLVRLDDAFTEVVDLVDAAQTL